MNITYQDGSKHETVQENMPFLPTRDIFTLQLLYNFYWISETTAPCDHQANHFTSGRNSQTFFWKIER
jgi:hypothetical protein